MSLGLCSKRFCQCFTPGIRKLSSSGAPELEYDVVVVGGGHNGLISAAYLAKMGVKTAVFERRHVLGTCLSCFLRSKFLM